MKMDLNKILERFFHNTFFFLLLGFNFSDGIALCSQDEFQCADGSRCIPSQWYCDGIPECLDLSDEPESCPEPSCQEGQFSCKKTGWNIILIV